MSLEVQDLAQRHAGSARASFRDVSFAVRAGELLLLAGLSGSGKSTLLRTIAGLEQASSGTVRVRGEAFVPGDAHALGLVFQTHELFPHLSVLANCTLALTAGRNVSSTEAKNVALAALTELGVDDLAERSPDRLSHGQRQRVAIARALALSPQVLLLDEPSASLDPLARQDLAHAIRRLKRRGIAMLLASHDFALLDVADRLGILADGHLAEEGVTSEILAAPKHAMTRAVLEAARGTWSQSRTAQGNG